MKTWLYNTKPVDGIEDLPHPDRLFGFVYKITNTETGQIYIGKKNFFTQRKQKLSKKLRPNDGRKKQYQIVRKQSDWLEYRSSCDSLHADLIRYGEQAFTREILGLSCSPKYLTYLELRFMFIYDVLGVPSYNANIAGKYFSRDVTSNCY